MDVTKISALATIIAIVSCKMKMEGFYELTEDGKEYHIKPEFIIELWEKYHYSKQFGDLTNEEIYQATHDTFSHSIRFYGKDNNEILLIEGLLCSGGLIDQIFNVVCIQPERHLIQGTPAYIPISHNSLNRENRE